MRLDLWRLPVPRPADLPLSGPVQLTLSGEPRLQPMYRKRSAGRTRSAEQWERSANLAGAARCEHLNCATELNVEIRGQK